MKLTARYRHYFYGGMTGSRKAQRAEVAACGRARRVNHMQMCLFYAICDYLSEQPDAPAPGASVGAYVNKRWLSGLGKPPQAIAPAVKACFAVLRSRQS